MPDKANATYALEYQITDIKEKINNLKHILLPEMAELLTDMITIIEEIKND
jgi:hypothetical protein